MVLGFGQRLRANLYLTGKKCERIFCINEDISTKKQDEEQRLSLVASLNNNGIVFTKPNGKIFWCNDAYTTYTGYSKDREKENTSKIGDFG
jgi:PAS domain-containing protein